MSPFMQAVIRRSLGAHAADPLTLVSPETIFGSASQPVAVQAASITGGAAPLTDALTSSPLFHIFTLLLLLLYMLSLYRRPKMLQGILSRIFSADRSRREEMYSHRSEPSRFHWLEMLLGSLFAGILVVRLVGDIVSVQITGSIPAYAAAWAVPAAAVLFRLTGLFQLGLLKLTGSITVSQSFVSSLLYLRKLYFRLLVLLSTPLLLLYALHLSGRSVPLAVLTALSVAFVAVLFLRETILLFVSKKVSILHWILYLCTVEIFPVSLFCLLASRA